MTAETSRELRALVISPDKALAARFAAARGPARCFAVAAELDAYPARTALEVRLRELRPDVVLVDLATDLERAVEVVGWIATLEPAAPVVGLHVRKDAEAILSALRRGACEFLYAPFDPAIQSQAAERIRRLLTPQQNPLPAAARVVAFASAKPGAGASTLAMQTAFALRRNTQQRVLLADMDVMGTAMAFYGAEAGLGAPANEAPRQAAAHGLDLLWAPAGDWPGAGNSRDLIAEARQRYSWILADVPGAFSRAAREVIPECNRVCVVTTPELPALHLAHRAVTLLARAGFEKERVSVLLNRVEKRGALGPAEIARVIGAPVRRSFPSEYFAIERAIAGRTPVAADSALGRAVGEFTAELITEFAEQATAVPR